MAAYQWTVAPYVFYSASDTCASAREAAGRYITANGNPGYVGVSCNTDPVNVGSIITFQQNGSPAGTWAITGKVLLSEMTVPAPAIDSGFIVATLLVIVLFALGYTPGRASA